MIDDREIRDRAREFGVPEAQIRRDHLLSHLTAGLPPQDRVVFIGGTALNRTHLPDMRLSEDLDIHLVEGAAEDLVAQLIEAVRLDYPGITVDSRQRRYGVSTFSLQVDVLRVQVQVITNRPEWRALPNEITPVRLRYSDLSESVDLVLPTVEAFAAMKLSAYVDRVAPRDLFDLRGLAERDALDDESLALVHQLLGRPLARQEFESSPSQNEWDIELSHQVADAGSPEEALDVVRRRLAELLGW